MDLQISLKAAILKFPAFSRYAYQNVKMWKKWKVFVWFRLRTFHAENIDFAFTENAEGPFVAIILIVNLNSLHYYLFTLLLHIKTLLMSVF